MAGIGRVGVDTAGGLITGSLAPTVFINGSPVVVIGATIAPHGEPPHVAAVMVTGSATVLANGIGVCRTGDLASCEHMLTPGSATVTIG